MKLTIFCTFALIVVTTAAARAETASDVNVSKANYRTSAALDLAQALGKKQIVCGDRLTISVARSSGNSATIQIKSNEINAVDAQISKDQNFYMISGEFDPPDTTVLLIPRGISDVDKDGHEISTIAEEFDVMFGYFSNHTDLSSTDAHSSVHCVLKK